MGKLIVIIQFSEKVSPLHFSNRNSTFSSSDTLKIPVEAFQNFDEEQAVNIISNTFDNGSILNAINHKPTFHPIEQIMKLHEEKIALYERMLKEKDEMMERLEKLITKK